MELDAFTVVAQVVNFLVLVLLLRRFLYRPVLEAVDARERSIASRIESTRQLEKAAATEKASFEQRMRDLGKEEERLLREARETSEQQRRRWMEEARDDVAETRRRWQDAVAKEKNRLLRELRAGTATLTLDVARRVLHDLGQADLQESVVDCFLAQLKTLERSQGMPLEHHGKVSESIRVRSAFTLSPSQRERIGAALHRFVPADADLRFEEDAELLLGVEVQMHGEKLAWSGAEYLERLEELLDSAKGSSYLPVQS